MSFQAMTGFCAVATPQSVSASETITNVRNSKCLEATDLQKETHREEPSKVCRFQAFWIPDIRDRLACTHTLWCGDRTKSSHRLERHSRHRGTESKSGHVSRFKYFWWYEPLSGLYAPGYL